MVSRVTDGVWRVNLRGVNAYLAADGDERILVDAGLPWHSGKIRDALDQLGWAPADLDAVLLTHYDVDHVGGLAGLDALSGPAYIGLADADYLTRQRRPPWTKKGTFQRVAGRLHGPPACPVEPLDDGEMVGSFTAYSAPGHTPGQLVYASEKLSVAFLGDAVMILNGRMRSVPGILCDDTGQARRDIVSLADRLPAFAAACPGHGVPFGAEGHQRLRHLASELQPSA